jgi:hypothetical protein
MLVTREDRNRFPLIQAVCQNYGMYNEILNFVKKEGKKNGNRTATSV